MGQRKKRRGTYSRRRQQVLRQRMILGFVLLVLAVVVGSCRAQIKKKEAEEAVQIENQKEKNHKSETAAKADEKETIEERIKRVEQEAKKQQYPDSVVELLEKNQETIDFVEDYGKKKDEPYAQTIGDDLTEGGIPLLLQWDERWGYAPYGTSIIAVSGCGPTCLAMVASGLTQDASITPAKVAEYGTQNGYVDENNDTYWAFMKEAGANWNLSCYDGMLTEEQARTELLAGHPIICSVGPGDFTQNGHFIVLTGYENGKIKVNDPFSRKNSAALWDFSRIEEQTRAMWVYSYAG